MDRQKLYSQLYGALSRSASSIASATGHADSHAQNSKSEAIEHLYQKAPTVDELGHDVSSERFYACNALLNIFKQEIASGKQNANPEPRLVSYLQNLVENLAILRYHPTAVGIARTAIDCSIILVTELSGSLAKSVMESLLDGFGKLLKINTAQKEEAEITGNFISCCLDQIRMCSKSPQCPQKLLHEILHLLVSFDQATYNNAAMYSSLGVSEDLLTRLHLSTLRCLDVGIEKGDVHGPRNEEKLYSKSDGDEQNSLFHQLVRVADRQLKSPYPELRTNALSLLVKASQHVQLLDQPLLDHMLEELHEIREIRSRTDLDLFSGVCDALVNFCGAQVCVNITDFIQLKIDNGNITNKSASFINWEATQKVIESIFEILWGQTALSVSSHAKRISSCFFDDGEAAQDQGNMDRVSLSDASDVVDNPSSLTEYAHIKLFQSIAAVCSHAFNFRSRKEFSSSYEEFTKGIKSGINKVHKLIRAELRELGKSSRKRWIAQMTLLSSGNTSNTSPMAYSENGNVRSDPSELMSSITEHYIAASTYVKLLSPFLHSLPSDGVGETCAEILLNIFTSQVERLPRPQTSKSANGDKTDAHKGAAEAEKIALEAAQDFSWIVSQALASASRLSESWNQSIVQSLLSHCDECFDTSLSDKTIALSPQVVSPCLKYIVANLKPNEWQWQGIALRDIYNQILFRISRMGRVALQEIQKDGQPGLDPESSSQSKPLRRGLFSRPRSVKKSGASSTNQRNARKVYPYHYLLDHIGYLLPVLAETMTQLWMHRTAGETAKPSRAWKEVWLILVSCKFFSTRVWPQPWVQSVRTIALLAPPCIFGRESAEYHAKIDSMCQLVLGSNHAYQHMLREDLTASLLKVPNVSRDHLQVLPVSQLVYLHAIYVLESTRILSLHEKSKMDQDTIENAFMSIFSYFQDSIFHHALRGNTAADKDDSIRQVYRSNGRTSRQRKSTHRTRILVNDISFLGDKYCLVLGKIADAIFEKYCSVCYRRNTEDFLRILRYHSCCLISQLGHRETVTRVLSYRYLVGMLTAFPFLMWDEVCVNHLNAVVESLKMFVWETSYSYNASTNEACLPWPGHHGVLKPLFVRPPTRRSKLMAIANEAIEFSVNWAARSLLLRGSFIQHGGFQGLALGPKGRVDVVFRTWLENAIANHESHNFPLGVRHALGNSIDTSQWKERDFHALSTGSFSGPSPGQISRLGARATSMVTAWRDFANSSIGRQACDWGLKNSVSLQTAKKLMQLLQQDIRLPCWLVDNHLYVAALRRLSSGVLAEDDSESDRLTDIEEDSDGAGSVGSSISHSEKALNRNDSSSSLLSSVIGLEDTLSGDQKNSKLYDSAVKGNFAASAYNLEFMLRKSSINHLLRNSQAPLNELDLLHPKGLSIPHQYEQSSVPSGVGLALEHIGAEELFRYLLNDIQDELCDHKGCSMPPVSVYEPFELHVVPQSIRRNDSEKYELPTNETEVGNLMQYLIYEVCGLHPESPSKCKSTPTTKANSILSQVAEILCTSNVTSMSLIFLLVKTLVWVPFRIHGSDAFVNATALWIQVFSSRKALRGVLVTEIIEAWIWKAHQPVDEAPSEQEHAKCLHTLGITFEKMLNECGAIEPLMLQEISRGVVCALPAVNELTHRSSCVRFAIPLATLTLRLLHRAQSNEVGAISIEAYNATSSVPSTSSHFSTGLQQTDGHCVLRFGGAGKRNGPFPSIDLGIVFHCDQRMFSSETERQNKTELSKLEVQRDEAGEGSDEDDTDEQDEVAPLPVSETRENHYRDLACQYMCYTLAPMQDWCKYTLQTCNRQWRDFLGSPALLRARVYQMVGIVFSKSTSRNVEKRTINEWLELCRRMHLDRLFLNSSCIAEREVVQVAYRLARVSANLASDATIANDAFCPTSELPAEQRHGEHSFDDYSVRPDSESGSIAVSRKPTNRRGVRPSVSGTASSLSVSDDASYGQTNKDNSTDKQNDYIEKLASAFKTYGTSNPWIVVSSQNQHSLSSPVSSLVGPTVLMDPFAVKPEKRNISSSQAAGYPRELLSSFALRGLCANGVIHGSAWDDNPNSLIIGAHSIEAAVSQLGFLVTALSHEVDMMYSWYNPTASPEKRLPEIEEFSLHKYASCVGASKGPFWSAEKASVDGSNEIGIMASKEHGWGVPGIKGIGLSYGISGASWQHHAHTAWTIHPKVAFSTSKRFRSVSSFVESIAELVGKCPSAGWKFPESLALLTDPSMIEHEDTVLYDPDLIAFRPCCPSVIVRLLVRCFPGHTRSTPAIAYPPVALYVSKSLRRMTPDDIIPFLPQLVQALRHTPHFILEKVMCDLAQASITLAHRLLWALQAEYEPHGELQKSGPLLRTHGFQDSLPGEDPLYSICSRVIQSIKESLGLREKHIFDGQYRFWEDITDISGRLKRELSKDGDKEGKITSFLKELSSECKAEYLQYTGDVSSLNRRLSRQILRYTGRDSASKSENESGEQNQSGVNVMDINLGTPLSPDAAARLVSDFQNAFLKKACKRAYGGAAKILGTSIPREHSISRPTGDTLPETENTPRGDNEIANVLKVNPEKIFQDTLIYLPTDPYKRVTRVILDSGRAMQSAAKCPYLLLFEVEDFDGPDAWTKQVISQDEQWKQEAIKSVSSLDSEQGPRVHSGSSKGKRTMQERWNQLRSKTRRTKARMVVKRQKLRSYVREGRTHVSNVVASKRRRAKTAVGHAIKAVRRIGRQKETTAETDSDSNHSQTGDSDNTVNELEEEEDYLSDGTAKSLRRGSESTLSDHSSSKKQNEELTSAESEREKPKKLRSKLGQVFKGRRRGKKQRERHPSDTESAPRSSFESKLQKRGCILKVYDDIRQDLLAMQIIDLLAYHFEIEETELMLFPYKVIPSRVGKDCAPGGILEVIPNARSLDDLGKSGAESLFVHFLNSHGRVDSEEFERARANFIRSAAAYAVACYVLWLKDRHNGNVMVDSQGSLIHIDFGFLLGISPGGNLGFETAAFKLTQEMIDVMGGDVNGEYFTEFRELCCRGLLIAAEHGREIEDVVCGMADSRLECFTFSYTLDFLRQRLRFGDSPRDVAEHMSERVLDSANKSSTIWYDGIQRLQQGIHSEAWQ